MLDEDALRESLWEAIVKVRDAYPRVVDDAPTEEVVDSVLKVLNDPEFLPDPQDDERAARYHYEHFESQLRAEGVDENTILYHRHRYIEAVRKSPEAIR